MRTLRLKSGGRFKDSYQTGKKDHGDRESVYLYIIFFRFNARTEHQFLEKLQAFNIYRYFPLLLYNVLILTKSVIPISSGRILHNIHTQLVIALSQMKNLSSAFISKNEVLTILILTLSGKLTV